MSISIFDLMEAEETLQYLCWNSSTDQQLVTTCEVYNILITYVNSFRTPLL